MSLSDADAFQPMVLTSLQNFGEEHANKTDTSEPDFDRFKLLFDKPRFEKEEFIGFNINPDAEKENGKKGFKSIIEKKVVPSDKKSAKQALQDLVNPPTQGNVLLSEAKAAGKERPAVENPLLSEKGTLLPPGEISEGKGVQEGFEQGFETGMAKGQKQGYDEGFTKGEVTGLEQGDRLGHEKGHQQGFEQGFEKGVEEGVTQETEKIRERVVNILEPLEVSLKTVDQTLDLLVEKYEQRIISLIQQIAKKAVMAQVEIDNEIVRPMILEALKTLVQPEEVVLKVSLEDYEYIEMIKDDFFEQIDSLNSVTIKSDPSIKRGGCKIETNTACVSADVESRLETIFEAIKAAGTA
jgi:flagellar assembly protein FliH